MKVVTAHSFRGGTGKTNVIANLSLALAKDGSKVAAIDSDVTHPSLHIMYGLGEKQPHPSLTEFLLGKCEPDQMMHDLSVEYRTSGKLYLVPSKLDEELITKVIREGYELGRLFRGLRETAKKAELDFMLIDTRPGLDEKTMLILAMTDILLVLTRNDEADLRGTLALLNIVDHFKISSKQILPNMIGETHFAHIMKALATRFEAHDASILKPLPYSENLSIRHSPKIDRLFIDKYPTDIYSRSIFELGAAVRRSSSIDRRAQHAFSSG